MLLRVASAAAAMELSWEVLVNADSRHIRQGDHAALLGALAARDVQRRDSNPRGPQDLPVV